MEGGNAFSGIKEHRRLGGRRSPSVRRDLLWNNVGGQVPTRGGGDRKRAGENGVGGGKRV